MTVVLSKNADQVEAAEIYKARYLEYTDKFSKGDILRLFNFLNKAQQELRYSQNQRIKIEISLSQLIGLEKTATISDLISDLNSSKSEEPITVSEPTRNNYYSSGSILKSDIAQTSNNEKPKAVVSSAGTSYHKPTAFSGFEDAGFNFDNIPQKWAGFVESISKEKSLTFGSFIKDLKLLNIEGNKINIYCDNPEIKEVIKFNLDYISQKTLDFFGKKMAFHFSDEPKNTEIAPPVVPPSKKAPDEKKESNGDPYIDAIMNELSGEELS